MENAKLCGLAGMDEIASDVLEQTPNVIESVQAIIPTGFPDAHHRPYHERIAHGQR